jgi:hypothetical protein
VQFPSLPHFEEIIAHASQPPSGIIFSHLIPKSINLKEEHGAPFLRGSFQTQKSPAMIRKLKSGQYRIYSRKVDSKTKRRRNLGTFDTLEAARQHEKAIQYFKHH